jgi:predicted RNase H-like HicB family nuclease
MKVQYTVIIEYVPGSNYSAYVPDLPGCVAASETRAEVEQLIREGIKFHLEGMRRRRPDPRTHIAGHRSRSSRITVWRRNNPHHLSPNG